MPPVIDYATPGRLTALDGVPPGALEPVVGDAAQICWPVHGLVVQPTDAEGIPLLPDRFATNQVRSAAALVRALLDLDPRPLDVLRPPDRRVVGTCRHFAVLSCALLRHRGVPARVRCGFATYFQPGDAVDHWITECWHEDAARWVRIDSELLGGTVLDHSEDLADGEFLAGAEAWQAFRRDEVDGSRFGVHGTENWGPAEIRGNAVRDLAALNKVEMLPWDEWGRMTEAYDGRTGADYDELLDTLAAACVTDDLAAIAEVYRHDDLRVPDDLVR